jgi:polyisoprenoid-binding protein YceI
MNLRIVIMLSMIALLTIAVTRSNNQLAPTSYVEYQASHGGSSWRGRAPIDRVAVSTKDERLELNVIVKSNRFDSGHLMRDGLASATVFESKTYPEITFTASVNVGVLNDDVQQVHLTGTLSMHGVTKEITVPVNLGRKSKQHFVTGTLEVKLSEYYMKRPMVAGSAINDDVTVMFNIKLDSEQMGQVSSYL